MSERTKYSGSVVIPLYNERDSLAELYTQLTSVMERTFAWHEIVFVDDGSTDGSVDVLREIRKRFPDVVTIMMTAYGRIESAVEATNGPSLMCEKAWASPSPVGRTAAAAMILSPSWTR